MATTLLTSTVMHVCVPAVSLGYKGVFVPRNTKDFCEGEATFYRASEFSLESSESLLLGDIINHVCSCQSFVVPDVFVS